MARCIPEQPDFTEAHSAERAVWLALKDALPDDAVLAHSVQVRHGSAEHEIDLLVLWPGVGLAAIEVKGGAVSIENGTWYSSGKDGKHRLKQSPVAQCQGAGHAFRHWIGDRLGTPLTSRFAYMVCLPYTRVPAEWSLTGAPRALLIDQDDLAGGAAADLAAHLRTAIETEGSGASGLAASYVERILPHLRGNLAAGAAPDGTAKEAEDRQDHLTERQTVLLSATRSLPRVRFVGGAGSGKTWLAVEKAKRLSRAGKRVGLFCYNKGLGMHLQQQVDRWRQAKPAFTGEFHEYVKSLGIPDGSGQDYFDVDMPLQLAELGATLPENQKFDAVVVDEAQDFAPLWWEGLLACCKDPQTAEIFAFMDDRQDVYRRWDGTALGGRPGWTPGAVLELVPIHVDENLRNTRRIAEAFQPLAGDHFTPRGETGQPVRFVPCPTEEALDVASDCVDALIEEGWANNQIALLTTKHRHPVHQDYFDQDKVPEYWAGFHAHEGEFYGHVLGFKGLERSVVVLCVNGFKDMTRAAEQLYVGLSRARSLLVVVGDPQLVAEAGGRELERALTAAKQWAPA